MKPQPRYLYMYAIVLPKSELVTGTITVPEDLYEGDTEENLSNAIRFVCNVREVDPSRIKNWTMREIPQEIMKDIFNG